MLLIQIYLLFVNLTMTSYHCQIRLESQFILLLIYFISYLILILIQKNLFIEHMEDNSSLQGQIFARKNYNNQENFITNQSQYTKRINIMQSNHKQKQNKNLKNKENQFLFQLEKYPQNKNKIELISNNIQNRQSLKNRSSSTGFKVASLNISTKLDYCISEQINQQNICLIHQKPLEVICISDTNIICTNCAIYGCHKGHEFKSKRELKQDKLTRCQKLLELIQKKKLTEEKILNKESRQKIDKELNKKKETMLLQMSDKFEKLKELMNQTEIRCIQKVEKEIEQETKLLDDILKNEEKYNQWEKKAETQLYCLNGEQNLQDQLKFLDYKKVNMQKDSINIGQAIIFEIQQKYKIALETVEDFTMSLQLVFDLNQIQNKLNYIENTFLSDKRKKNLDQNFHTLINKADESLSNDQLLLDSLKNSSKLIDLHISLNNHQFYQPDQQLNSPKVNFTKKNNSAKRNSSTNSINSSKTVPKKIKLFIPQKYEKILNSYIQSDVEIVDFSHGELGDQNIVKILQQLKGKNVKQLKLIKNKLTDMIIQRIWPLIHSVITLNLAQNNFTQKIIDSLLFHIKQLPLLKSVTLTQNKIRDRNVKCRLQQIRKYGVHVLV